MFAAGEKLYSKSHLHLVILHSCRAHGRAPTVYLMVEREQMRKKSDMSESSVFLKLDAL